MNQPQLPSLSTASGPDKADFLVVGLADASSGPVLVGVPADVEKAWGKRSGSSLLDAALQLGAESSVGSTVVLPGSPALVVTGLGDVDVTPEDVRRAAGNGVRAAAKVAGKRQVGVAVSLEALEPEIIRAATEGALLGAYAYEKASTTATPRPVQRLVLVSSARDAKALVAEGEAVARAVCQARDWVNTPPNVLYPESFAQQIQAVAKGTKLGVEVLDEKALTKGGFGGIMAVGGGSSRPPRLVKVEYAPRGAKAHLALIGKGITFDSGGLNLKPGDSMLTMKSDMAGAAAVVCAAGAIAELGLPVKVTVWAALAENLPSSTAFRPSDVLTMYGGTTVENVNSDAEGRLVMADALARASEDDPDMILDVATLTGACMVALGERVAGLMASDDETADAVLDAAEASGEMFWQLPIPAHVSDNLKSKVADLASSGSKRWGGALTAAAFLREFVADDAHWAHLDIAGPSYNDGAPYDYVPAGGTGVAVRTLVALARSLSVRQPN